MLQQVWISFNLKIIHGVHSLKCCLDQKVANFNIESYKEIGLVQMLATGKNTFLLTSGLRFDYPNITV